MLKPEQYTAIEWLVQPKHGGKTMEEIAELCGVSRQTLYHWRRSDEFQAEIKRQVVRHTAERLGDIMNAMVESAVSLKSAAAAKLVLQANGILKDKLEVETKQSENVTDIAALKARLEAFKQRDVK